MVVNQKAEKDIFSGKSGTRKKKKNQVCYTEGIIDILCIKYNTIMLHYAWHVLKFYPKISKCFGIFVYQSHLVNRNSTHKSFKL